MNAFAYPVVWVKYIIQTVHRKSNLAIDALWNCLTNTSFFLPFLTQEIPCRLLQPQPIGCSRPGDRN